MKEESLFRAIALIRRMIISPLEAFHQIETGAISKITIYLVLGTGMVITLIKAFFARWHKAFDFFDAQYLNDTIIFLNNPFIMWLREWLIYFTMLFLLVQLCKIFFKSRCENLPYMVMAISSLGLLCQVLFLPLNYLLSHDLLKIVGLIFYLWNLILILFAVKIAGSLSYMRASVVLLIPLIVFFFSPFGMWSFMTPYFLFIY